MEKQLDIVISELAKITSEIIDLDEVEHIEHKNYVPNYEKYLMRKVVSPSPEQTKTVQTESESIAGEEIDSMDDDTQITKISQPKDYGNIYNIRGKAQNGHTYIMSPHKRKKHQKFGAGFRDLGMKPQPLPRRKPGEKRVPIKPYKSYPNENLPTLDAVEPGFRRLKVEYDTPKHTSDHQNKGHEHDNDDHEHGYSDHDTQLYHAANGDTIDLSQFMPPPRYNWTEADYWRGVLPPGTKPTQKQLTNFTRSEEYQWSYRHYLAYKDDPNKETPIVILDWYEGMRKNKTFLTLSDEKCGACFYTNDHNFEKTADAIVIDTTEYMGLMRWNDEGVKTEDAPDTMNRNTKSQYWIAYPRESAAKGFKLAVNMTIKDENNNTMDQAFNYTMSIRDDSDIVLHPQINDILHWTRFKFASRWNNDLHGYGRLIENDTIHHYNILENKYKDRSKNYIAWVVSNCNKTAGAIERYEYGKKLIEAGLPVDVFGFCFPEANKTNSYYYKELAINDGKVKSKKDHAPWTRLLTVLSKYKFYLAFENGIHCKDYISEKFWRNSFMGFMVPIVFGPHPADVKKLAPKHSYIHTESYPEPKNLIKYLNYLNENDNEYMKYHQWRFNYDIDISQPVSTHTRKRVCGTCQLLREKKKQGYPVRMIKSFTSWWWMNTHDNRCVNGTEMPEFLKKINPPVSMRDNWYDELREASS